MRTGRPKQALRVSEEERRRLGSLAQRARSLPAVARRARVVLACAEGLDNRAVAKKLRCSLGMVGKWRARFLKERLEGLYDEQRPGAPRKISDEQIEQVVISDAGEYTAWTNSLEHARDGQKHRTQPHGH
jgi:transposase